MYVYVCGVEGEMVSVGEDEERGGETDLDDDGGKGSSKFPQSIELVLAVDVDPQSVFARNNDDRLQKDRFSIYFFRSG